MAAFREAIRANKGIELDVHLTKDKKIAVFHDDSLKRMCKVSGTIEEKTWEELKKLRLLETAEPIPLLEDVLHLVQEMCIRDRVYTKEAETADQYIEKTVRRRCV